MLRMSIDGRSNVNVTNWQSRLESSLPYEFSWMRCTYVPSKLHDREEVANAVPKTCHVNDLNQDKVVVDQDTQQFDKWRCNNWIRSYRVMVGPTKLDAKLRPNIPSPQLALSFLSLISSLPLQIISVSS
jgi:hypothetical protein